MYIIERANFVREQIRHSFPDANNFIFEHLVDGFFRVSLNIDDKTAYLVADSNEDIKTIMSKLFKSVDKPYNFLDDLSLESEIDLKEPERQEIKPEVVLENFKNLHSLFTPEEIEESNLEIKNTRLNRVWLLENKKSFVNTAQTKKFHELANKARASSPKNIDYVILKAYTDASRE